MSQAQNLDVARAVFTTTLLRADAAAAPVSRDDATLFARAILRACNICTRMNIKVCKSFIVKNILPSQPRTAALLKYLVTLSKAFTPRDPDARVDTTKPGDENEGLGKIINGRVQQPPEAAFKRLHILYIIHDVLLHYHVHRDSYDQPEIWATLDGMQPDVAKLAELAACGCSGKASSTCEEVLQLLTFWEHTVMFSTEQINEMRKHVRAADGMDWEAAINSLAAREERTAHQERQRREDETKWMIPDRHGVLNDPTAPWHELPATNGLYLKRTAGFPLYAADLPPGGIKIQKGGREADAEMKNDVLSLYDEVIKCFDKYTPAEEVQDVDALGNVIWKDPERPTRNYWGFTLDGIDKRKELSARFATTIGPNQGSRGGNGYREDDFTQNRRGPAADHGRDMGRGRGMNMGGRAGWRGGRRW